MSAEQLNMEPDERDREVLRVLADGRANPKLIRDETGIEKGDLNTVLVRLGRSGYVRQVTRGPDEITDDGREEIGATEADVDVAAVRSALADIEAATERGDGDAVMGAVERAKGAIGDE